MSSNFIPPQKAKFKVGNIICQHTYPGRDHWQQVGEVIAVYPSYYELRPIQWRTTDREWSTNGEISGAKYLSRGDWKEEQTSLFNGKTLEQEENDKEEKIRQIVRKEFATLVDTLSKRVAELERINVE